MLVEVLAAVVLLVLVLVLVLRSRRPSRDTVVLYGPPQSGKTALFFRLKTGSFVPGTVASMAENTGTFAWQGVSSSPAPVRTVDIPGHARLRWRLRDFFPQCRSVVVVIDAT